MPDQYYSLTWAQYIQKCNGYAKREQRRSKDAWNNTRSIMWIIGMVNAKDPKRYPSLESFLSDEKEVGGSVKDRLRAKLQAFKEQEAANASAVPPASP